MSKSGRQTSTEYVQNPLLKGMDDDVLYHLNLSRKDNDLKGMFGDVKFVCIGGTAHRMKQFALLVAKELGYGDMDLPDLASGAHRYSLYKVGPVLCANHGIGFASVMIVLVELIKLMYYAGVRDPIIFRIGTCSGVEQTLGTVIITNEVVNDFFEPNARVPVLGKLIERPAVVDQDLAGKLKSIVDGKLDFPLIMGKTMSVEHLYESNAMRNNVILASTDEERKQFYDLMKQQKIVNIEMESLILFSMVHALGIKAATVTVVEDTRIGDISMVATAAQRSEWQIRSQKIVLEYIKNYVSQQ